MSQIQRLRPAGLVHSRAFSHVTIVPAGASTIYVGGQNSVDETGALIGDGEIAVQVSRALDNAETALAAAGAGLADVIQWNVLLIEGVEPGAAYGVIAVRLAGAEPPLVTAAFVAGLGVPGALVELSAVAARLPSAQGHQVLEH